MAQILRLRAHRFAALHHLLTGMAQANPPVETATDQADSATTPPTKGPAPNAKPREHNQ